MLGPVLILDQDVEGTISEAHWERFELLAARVRAIYFLRGIVTGPSLIELLATRYNGSRATPFPNLQILLWLDSNGDPLQARLLRVLCTPPPQHVFWVRRPYGFGERDPPEDDLTLVADIAVTGENEMRHFHYDTSIPMRLQGPLLRFQALRSLVLVGLVTPTVYHTHLATLPCLEDLEINGEFIFDEPDSKVIRTQRSGREFPVLQRLVLRHGHRPSTLLDALSALSSPNLRSLTLGTALAQAQDLTDLVQGLSSLPSTHALQELRIELGYHHTTDPWGDMETETTILVAALVPHLSRICHVTHFSLLRLSDVWTIAIANEDLAQLAQVWRQLVSISVSSVIELTEYSFQYERRSDTPRPTLRGLVALMEECPRLDVIDVPTADITEVDMNELEAYIMLSRPNSGSHLRVLTLYTSPSQAQKRTGLPADLDRLARVLCEIFPHLRSTVEPRPWRVSPPWKDEEERLATIRAELRELQKVLNNHRGV